MAEMEKIRDDKHFDFVILMITDVLQEGSHLLYVGATRKCSRPSARSPGTTACSCPAS